MKKTILNYLFSLSVIVLFTACDNSDGYKIEIIKLDEIKLNLPEDFLNRYHLYDVYKSDNEIEIFAYNHFNNKIDVININKLSESYSIKIDEKDISPNSISDIKIINPDSIIVKSHRGLFLLNIKGYVYNRVKIDSLALTHNGVFVRNFTVDKNNKIIYFPFRFNNFRTNYREFLYSPKVASYNLNNRAFNIENIHYLEEKKNLGKKLTVQSPYLKLDGKYLYYNYYTNSKVFRLNLQNNKVDSILAKSIFSKNYTDPLKMGSKYDDNVNFFENPFFQRLKTDPKSKYIWRLHSIDLEYEKINGNYPTFDDKEHAISVISKHEFKLKGENKISETGIHPDFSFVIEDKLYLCKEDEKTEKLTFSIYTIK